MACERGADTRNPYYLCHSSRQSLAARIKITLINQDQISSLAMANATKYLLQLCFVFEIKPAYYMHRFCSNGSIVEAMRCTANPTFVSRGSMRTILPRHLSIILPPGVSTATLTLISLPTAYFASVSMYNPVSLTSRVTPVAASRLTGIRVKTRSLPLFSWSPVTKKVID